MNERWMDHWAHSPWMVWMSELSILAWVGHAISDYEAQSTDRLSMSSVSDCWHPWFHAIELAIIEQANQPKITTLDSSIVPSVKMLSKLTHSPPYMKPETSLNNGSKITVQSNFTIPYKVCYLIKMLPLSPDLPTFKWYKNGMLIWCSYLPVFIQRLFTNVFWVSTLSWLIFAEIWKASCQTQFLQMSKFTLLTQEPRSFPLIRSLKSTRDFTTNDPKFRFLIQRAYFS